MKAEGFPILAACAAAELSTLRPSPLLDGSAIPSVPERTDFSTLKSSPEFRVRIAEIRTNLVHQGSPCHLRAGLGRSSFLPSE